MRIAFCFILLFNYSFSQSNFEVGYLFGGNATTFVNVKSNEPIWGYRNPVVFSTWSNHFFLGYGGKKNKLFISFDSGGLGVLYKAKVYADKFPYEERSDGYSPTFDLSLSTNINSKHRQNTNLLKFSVSFKHNFCPTRGFSHKSILGLGYLKTRQETPLVGTARMTLNDSLGIITHVLSIDKYAYFRTSNAYLIVGYEFSLPIGKRWNWNTSLIYNQGIFKMIRWKASRDYSESLTGYSEHAEQWTYTRLSYFSILTGVSFKLMK